MYTRSTIWFDPSTTTTQKELTMCPPCLCDTCPVHFQLYPSSSVFMKLSGPCHPTPVQQMAPVFPAFPFHLLLLLRCHFLLLEGLLPVSCCISLPLWKSCMLPNVSLCFSLILSALHVSDWRLKRYFSHKTQNKEVTDTRKLHKAETESLSLNNQQSKSLWMPLKALKITYLIFE